MSHLRSDTVIRRLVAALEACAAEEAGLYANDDWAGLHDLFAHELALLHRLAHEREIGGQLLSADTDLMVRVGQVRERHGQLRARLAQSGGQMSATMSGLGEAGHRVRAIHSSYRLNAA